MYKIIIKRDEDGNLTKSEFVNEMHKVHLHSALTNKGRAIYSKVLLREMVKSDLYRLRVKEDATDNELVKIELLERQLSVMCNNNGWTEPSTLLSLATSFEGLPNELKLLMAYNLSAHNSLLTISGDRLINTPIALDTREFYKLIKSNIDAFKKGTLKKDTLEEIKTGYNNIIAKMLNLSEASEYNKKFIEPTKQWCTFEFLNTLAGVSKLNKNNLLTVKTPLKSLDSFNNVIYQWCVSEGYYQSKTEKIKNVVTLDQLLNL